MRVLHIVHDFLPRHVAGVEVYTENLTQRLAAEHEVAIAYSEVVPDAPNYALRRGRRGKVFTYEIVNNHRLRGFEETYRNPAVDRRMTEVLDEFRPDVVHVQHLINLSIDVVRDAKRRGIPVVMTLHDHWLECANGGQRFHPRLGLCTTLDAQRCAGCTAHMTGTGLGARGWLRRRHARAGASEEGLDLTTLAPHVETPDAAFVYRDAYALDGAAHPTFVAHPPARLRFDVETGRGGRFLAAAAMHPDTFERPGGAVRFRVRVDGDVRAEETLDPKRRAEDRRPLRIDVTLPAGRCAIELETEAVPAGRADYCTAGWIAPRIVAEQGDARAVASPWLRPMRAAARLAARVPRSQQRLRIQRRWASMRELGELVDAFVSPSRYLRDELARFGLDAGKIVHCDYGFATEGFRRRTDLPERARRYAFIGSLVPHKGVHVLIDAFDAMPRDAELEICGSHDYDPPYTDALLRRAAHPGIRFVGGIPPERVAEHQQRIDCQVVPSIWRENSPLTIHEAFLSGVPVVASRMGGSAELLEHGGGLLYDAGDADALAAQLRRLYDEPGLARRLAASAPRVKPMGEHARELVGLYEELRSARARAHDAR
ncbi:MAG: glycosyltransferase [Myxococcales bacterium]|nr:glycosyltransferase [Myxococcales bacterium]